MAIKSEALDIALPDALTPLDCDLRGNEWMPMHGNKLYNSYFDAHASDAEWRAANKLWWFAWNQVPAASIADDDVILCKAAGLGRDIKTWKKIKTMALHGFVKCADGRLYHRFLASEAVVAFAKRLKADRKRADDLARLQAWRAARQTSKPKGSNDTPPETRFETPCDTSDETPSDTPPETHLKHRVTRGRQDKTRQDTKIAKQLLTQSPRERPPTMPARDAPPDAWEGLAESWSTDTHGVRHPVVEGYFVDGVVQDVCDAAGFTDPGFVGEWDVIIGWLKAGIETDAMIATVRTVASRARGSGRPPASLRYFDKAVREQRVAA